jgi:hypothetical protein
VDSQLFPYLSGFSQRASGPDTIEYKIGQIFGEIQNKISSGYNLREIIDTIDGLRFRSQPEKHELSMLYEEKIARMGNAGRNGGEYYTPRPLIRAMIAVTRPQIGEMVGGGSGEWEAVGVNTSATRSAVEQASKASRERKSAFFALPQKSLYCVSVCPCGNLSAYCQIWTG